MIEVDATFFKYIPCVIANLGDRMKLIIHLLSKKTTVVEREKSHSL